MPKNLIKLILNQEERVWLNELLTRQLQYYKKNSGSNWAHVGHLMCQNIGQKIERAVDNQARLFLSRDEETIVTRKQLQCAHPHDKTSCNILDCTFWHNCDLFESNPNIKNTIMKKLVINGEVDLKKLTRIR